LPDLLFYPALGAVAGLLAGLLGVGGGLIIVPALAWFFAAKGFPSAYILHMGLGTSLASIIFTSISSFRAHHRRGAVDWRVVMRITPGIVAGMLGGAWLAGRLDTQSLKIFFSCFLLYAGTQMLLDIRPKPSRSLPGDAGMTAAGAGIGVVSALVGIGGGTLTVPFLTWCNVVLHRAIGTSSAVGLPIALFGAMGYVWQGWGVKLPAGSVGFVFLPALAGIVLGSVLTAPVGAHLAHALPVSRLKKIFALLLYILAARMIGTL
jgi:uncharacterized membrane protein YfcA